MTTASAMITPDLPIIDCHHHLWVHPDGHYLVADYQADLATVPHVEASVYVECSAMYRASGPKALRCVGEAEFVAGQAAMSDSGQFGPTRICAGFVGATDFTLGDAVDDVLDALTMASGGRLRGIRGAAVWDADPSVNFGRRTLAPPGLLLKPSFRAGFARLAQRGLVYDAWQYYPQLADVCSLASAFPNTTIVVNHCGGLLGVGAYDRPDNFARWKHCVIEVAQCPNVLMKLGGLGGRRCGFRYDGRRPPQTATSLASDWRPYVETCIEAFGAHRCMFESNFPVDQIAGDYATIWNAFKLIATGCSVAEKADLFSETARRTYRIG